MRLAELVSYLDEYLLIRDVPDYPNAVNGLQVESAARIERIAVAVDASEQAIRESIRRGCNLLIVHHGLFWAGLQPVAGRMYRKLRACLDGELAIYSAHLPLDIHPEVGNNAVLARAIDLTVQGTWGKYRGIDLGVHGRLTLERDELTAQLERVLGGPVRLLPGGPARIERLGIITGGAASYVAEALAMGLDAFVTGEGAHHTYHDALEGGLNVFLGGHYFTEVGGVHALANHIERRFGMPWEFVAEPTGF
jgi:dinuclear metal center YbgI/SA1388 family protein